MTSKAIILMLAGLAFNVLAQDTCHAGEYSPVRQMLVYFQGPNREEIRGYPLSDIDSITFSGSDMVVDYKWLSGEASRKTFSTQSLDSMTFISNPQFTVLTPNGGETYQVGDTIWLRWATDMRKRTTPADFLYIRLGERSTFGQIITSDFSTDPSRVFHDSLFIFDRSCVGTYPWAVQDTSYFPNLYPSDVYTVSSECRLKVDDMYDQNGCQWVEALGAYLHAQGPSDMSDQTFTITE